jgi:hypothetical protein
MGEGHVAGWDEDRLPLCRDCLELLLSDPEAFWRAVRPVRPDNQ